MEAQTYMTVAYGMTQDPKFLAGLEQCIKWRYHWYTVRQKLTFPPESVVPWDDELAFNCYGPLLRYTRDPYLLHLPAEHRADLGSIAHATGALLQLHLRLVDRQRLRGAQAVWYVREWPLDLVNHSYRNSHRADLGPRRGYVS